jgi:hypothetical protein
MMNVLNNASNNYYLFDDSARKRGIDADDSTVYAFLETKYRMYT